MGFYLQAQPWADTRLDGPGAPLALRAGVLQQLAAQLQDMVAALRQETMPGGIERVSIRLRPEYLGEVVLRISVDPNGSVIARFSVDNPQVRAWIEQDLPQLRAALAQHGLNLADAGVDSGLGSGGDPWFQAGAGPGWGGGSDQPARQWPGTAAGHGPAASTLAAETWPERGETHAPAGVYRTSLIDLRV
ncbi:MAG TPA: flagellar hook-length control protein FliK [Limnochordales bacterium]